MFAAGTLSVALTKEPEPSCDHSESAHSERDTGFITAKHSVVRNTRKNVQQKGFSLSV